MSSIDEGEEMVPQQQQEPVSIRNDLVKTAVDFLRIPKVTGSSVERKKNFLRSKGLNESEIELAFNQSGLTFSPSSSPAGDYDSFNEIYSFTQQQQHQQSTSSWSSSLSRFTFSTAVVGGICYGGYQLFKRYIQPKILRYFSDRLDGIEKKLDNMMETVKKLENETSSEKLQQNIHSVMMMNSRPNAVEIHAINDLKSEISSIKALMLSKNSLTVKPASEATIPAWQLNKPIITNGKSKKNSAEVTTPESDNGNVENTTIDSELAEDW